MTPDASASWGSQARVADVAALCEEPDAEASGVHSLGGRHRERPQRRPAKLLEAATGEVGVKALAFVWQGLKPSLQHPAVAEVASKAEAISRHAGVNPLTRTRRQPCLQPALFSVDYSS